MGDNLNDLIDDDEGQYNDTGDTFDLAVWHDQIDTLENMTKNSSIDDVINLIKTDILNTTKSIDVTSGGVLLKSGKTLGDYGFPKPSAFANYVSVTFSARGGSSIFDDEKSSQRVRKLNLKKHKRLKKSSKTNDSMMGYAVEGGCAEMSCGCAVAPSTMFNYIKSIFEKFQSSYKIKCPFHKSVEWDWDHCTAVADMTYNEYFKWSNERNKRKLVNFRQCPNCKKLCKRKEGVIIFRMNCEGCSGGDFCWNCSKKWNNSGNVICGNKECEYVKTVNEELRTAPLIQPSGFQKQVPSIRACPRCLTRMRWTADCKHMTCAKCGKQFCFSCLALKSSDGKWPCSGDKYQCPVNGRQRFG